MRRQSAFLINRQDRGYLFAISVDTERTQSGNKVVFARDDANIIDWIQNALGAAGKC